MTGSPWRAAVPAAGYACHDQVPDLGTPDRDRGWGNRWSDPATLLLTAIGAGSDPEPHLTVSQQLMRLMADQDRFLDGTW